MPATSLPVPVDIARAHSEKLQALIAGRIGNGSISFADFMHHALYEPGLGYYMAGAQKFGETGDFVTAPEISPLFGQCIAQSCRSLFKELSATVLELGAGSGKLASSILIALSDVTKLEYLILEPSAELQLRQQRHLCAALTHDQYAAVTWLTALPESFEGVVIANEVMDALPVDRIRVGEVVQQARVSWQNSQFTEHFVSAPGQLQSDWARIQQGLGDPLPHGYHTEMPQLLGPWLSSLADSIKTGALLLIDYGYPRREYYAAERVNGTLACYHQHRMHDDAFWWPGLQDITAHVDFTRVIEEGTSNGLELLGYTSQSSFLLDNGLMDHLQMANDACQTEVDKLRLSQAVKKLTLPGEMGERFQVMAMGKGLDKEPTGFSLQELSRRL
ncbi:MAG: SAM-dependent methyltransferase [Granulosicoccaceae bacterium]